MQDVTKKYTREERVWEQATKHGKVIIEEIPAPQPEPKASAPWFRGAPAPIQTGSAGDEEETIGCIIHSGSTFHFLCSFASSSLLIFPGFRFAFIRVSDC